MSGSNETFIVRVRRSERDAIVEQPSRSRRRRIPEVSGVGELITQWLDQGPAQPEVPPIVHAEKEEWT